MGPSRGSPSRDSIYRVPDPWSLQPSLSTAVVTLGSNRPGDGRGHLCSCPSVTTSESTAPVCVHLYCPCRRQPSVSTQPSGASVLHLPPRASVTGSVSFTGLRTTARGQVSASAVSKPPVASNTSFLFSRVLRDHSAFLGSLWQ